jgi:hypothetical protein
MIEPITFRPIAVTSRIFKIINYNLDILSAIAINKVPVYQIFSNSI